MKKYIGKKIITALITVLGAYMFFCYLNPLPIEPKFNFDIQKAVVMTGISSPGCFAYPRYRTMLTEYDEKEVVQRYLDSIEIGDMVEPSYPSGEFILIETASETIMVGLFSKTIFIKRDYWLSYRDQMKTQTWRYEADIPREIYDLFGRECFTGQA